MLCRIQEFRYKDVVCMEDGTRLGYVGDVEIDTETAQLRSIVIYGKYHWLFFAREEDIVVPWEEIRLIGEDTILVNVTAAVTKRKKPRRFFHRDEREGESDETKEKSENS